MVYITIPSMASFDEAVKLDDGSLDPEHLSMKELMERYTIQEVSLVSLKSHRHSSPREC